MKNQHRADQRLQHRRRVVVAALLGAAFGELVSGHDVFTPGQLWVLVGSVIFVLVGRTAAYPASPLLRHGRVRRQRTLMIGSAATADEIRGVVSANPSRDLTDRPLLLAGRS